MSYIRQWLEELGLGQYADAFEGNHIDRAVLPHLTYPFLREMGVASVGHRVKIQSAIEALADADEPFVEISEPESPAQESPADGSPAQESPVAERASTSPDSEGAGAMPAPREPRHRQFTVMFCDLAGSDALSERLGPDAVSSVMEAYRRAAGMVVERYGGHVARHPGEGLMAYFGWPRAHEDDAHRAARTGLGIVSLVEGIVAPVALSVRVGISTGPVVVGETGTGADSTPEQAVGETPNLAARRIQGLAQPNTVMIGEDTRRLIQASFDIEGPSAEPRAGIEDGTAIYRVLGESKAERGFGRN